MLLQGIQEDLDEDEEVSCFGRVGGQDSDSYQSLNGKTGGRRHAMISSSPVQRFCSQRFIANSFSWTNLIMAQYPF